MDKIILLKKFKWVDGFFWLMFLWSSIPAVYADEGMPLPGLRVAGVLPLQTEGEPLDIHNEIKQGLESAFSESVHKSYRFFMLQNDLVAKYYESVAGKEELKSRYELDVFMSLSVAKVNRRCELIVKMLNADMHLWLQETFVFSCVDLSIEHIEPLKAQITSLTYMLINRLPVDVVITSIHGKYVTLSGGSDQGLHVGDQVAIIRPMIRRLHPANQTWFDFESRPMGQAKIVDLREKSSVAAMTYLVEENILQVGDGLKSQSLPTRIYFDASSKGESTDRATSGEIMVLSPRVEAIHSPLLGSAPVPASVPMPPVASLSMLHPQRMFPAHVMLPSQAPIAGSRPEGRSIRILGKPVLLREGEGAVGHKAWTFMKGSKSTHSHEPWYKMLNSYGVQSVWEALPQCLATLFLEAEFGETAAGGDYSLLVPGVKIFYEGNVPDHAYGLKHWIAGVVVSWNTFTVNKDFIGGMDYLELGVMGGVTGSLNVSQTQRMHYTHTLSLLPMHLGRLGYDGDYYRVRSSFGWKMSSTAFLEGRQGGMEWGAGLSGAAQDHFDVSNQLSVLKSWSVSLLGRYLF